MEIVRDLNRSYILCSERYLKLVTQLHSVSAKTELNYNTND